MVYQIGNRRLSVISSLFCGRVNDVHICCEEGQGSESYVTLLVIKDRQTARAVVELAAGNDSRMPWLEAFPWRDEYCLLFEYRSPRPIREFFLINEYPGMDRWEKLGLGMVVRCMEESACSHAFLYLLLKQEQFHIDANGEIYVNYFLDLDMLDTGVEEGACTCACAELLAGWMGELGCPKSPELLLRKVDRAAYRSFRELYQDVKLIVSPEKKRGVIPRIIAWGYERRNLGFRLLVLFSFLLAAVALVTLVSQIVSGDVGWFRLLFHTFEKIGTETLS
ncbi:MAG: hypothetical protein KHZ58_06665 [Hungatella hathewayi]|nr:hypothetical protein [Hungatella hathewayi]